MLFKRYHARSWLAHRALGWATLSLWSNNSQNQYGDKNQGYRLHNKWISNGLCASTTSRFVHRVVDLFYGHSFSFFSAVTLYLFQDAVFIILFEGWYSTVRSFHNHAGYSLQGRGYSRGYFFYKWVQLQLKRGSNSWLRQVCIFSYPPYALS